jgi:hypothetical protein
MQTQLKIKLCDLVIHDENFFIRKAGAGILQTQQGVEVDVIPIGEVIGIQEAVEIRHKVLAHGSIFFLQQFNSTYNVFR